MLWANTGGVITKDYEELNAGTPFGSGLSSWLERSPGFMMDKVAAPVRIQAIGPAGSLMGEWEWYAGLTRLGRAVELVWIPDGTHILEKPWDRMISQQGDVDWLRFWLKEEEDTDPDKAEQYARWRALQKSQ
jgi:hypothetical protein